MSGPVRGREPVDDFQRGLGRLLLGATVLSAGLLAVAVLWPHAGRAGGTAGVVVLLSAPFVAILTAGALYARRGEWHPAATAGLLLAILAAGLWIQGG